MNRFLLAAAAVAAVLLPALAQAQVTPTVKQAATREVEFPGYAVGGAVQLFDLSGNVLGTSSNPFYTICSSGCTSGGGGTGANNADSVAAVGTGLALEQSYPFLWNGSNFDRWYGDKTNGAWVNIKTSVLPTGAALETGGNLAQLATDSGAPGATACATDTASCNFNQLLQRLAQRLTTINTTLGSPFQASASIGNTSFAAQFSTNNANATPHLCGSTSPFKHITSATDTQLLAASGSNNIYICDIRFSASAALNFYLEKSSSGTCASPTQIDILITAAANEAHLPSSAFYQGLNTGASQQLCVNTSAGNLDISVIYDQY